MATIETPESGVRKIESVVTHHLKDGKTDCPMSEKHGSPMTWPAGNSYSRRWKDVDCEECLKHKPEGA
jgi:hypothetical protein